MEKTCQNAFPFAVCLLCQAYGDSLGVDGQTFADIGVSPTIFRLKLKPWFWTFGKYQANERAGDL
jgi:hypothetical protein